MINGRTLRRADCPDADRVASLQNGHLSAGEITVLEDHVATCPHCGELLDALDAPSDAVVRALATLPTSADDEPEFQFLRESLLTASWCQDFSARSDSRLADPPIGPLPQVLGNYELLDCIGRGAWGAVYRARHRTLDQTVAVKVLDSSRWPNAAFLERFIHEAQAAGQLTHPNVVRATDAGEDRGLHYLVMEYIEGVDAARLLRQRGPLAVADACEIARQAAAALDFAHARGWVHRDVKPSNLMITPAGTVKLLDLGIAGRRDEADHARAEDQPPMGTAGYMAPEQWTDFAVVDSRADVYSLGCTLFKLLTGHPPGGESRPPSRTPPAPIAAPSIAAHRPDVRRRLDRFVARMLAERPAERVATAAEVADKLAPWARRANLRRLVAEVCGHEVQSDPEALSPGPAVAPAGRRIARRALLAGGAAAVAGAAFGVPWMFLRGPSQLRRREWRLLAPTAPTVLLAVEPSESIHVASVADGSISVRSQDLVLVHLGRAVTGVFALQVHLRQDPWQQGAGVFFQYNWKDDKPVCEFQAIELRAGGDSSSPRSGLLLWSRCTAQIDAGKIVVRRDPWAETEVSLADRDVGQSLQVVLGRTGFPEVEWNGRLLAQAVWDLSIDGRRQTSGPPESLGRQYLGRLGLLNAGGATTFSSPQLAYL